MLEIQVQLVNKFAVTIMNIKSAFVRESCRISYRSESFYAACSSTTPDQAGEIYIFPANRISNLT